MTNITLGTPAPTRSILDVTENVLVAALSLFGVFVLFALRELWLPAVWQNTFGKWKCGSIRNVHCIGWCWACCCPCCSDRFHPPFRLRVAVQEGWNLRQKDVMRTMECYVVVSCGTNPAKTSSARKIPTSNNRYPVVWNDIVDLEVAIADEHVTIHVMDLDGPNSDEVVGEANLAISDFFYKMEGELSEVKCLEHVRKKLLFRNQDAGEIVVSLYATGSGKPLPPVVPGMALDPSQGGAEYQPLMSTLLNSWGFGV